MSDVVIARPEPQVVVVEAAADVVLVVTPATPPPVVVVTPPAAPPTVVIISTGGGGGVDLGDTLQGQVLFNLDGKKIGGHAGLMYDPSGPGQLSVSAVSGFTGYAAFMGGLGVLGTPIEMLSSDFARGAVIACGGRGLLEFMSPMAAPGAYTLENSGIVVSDQAGAEIFRIWGTDPNVLANYNSQNLYIGFEAGKNQPTDNVSAGYSNVGIGGGALANVTTGNTNVAIGQDVMSLSSSAMMEVALGWNTLAHSNGMMNVGVGALSLFSATDAFLNAAFGPMALAGLVDGEYNVAVGASAGMGMLFPTTELRKLRAGQPVPRMPEDMQSLHDSQMVFIGALSSRAEGADPERSVLPPMTNGIGIGYNVKVPASNTAVIGNLDVTDVYFGGVGGAANLHAKGLISTGPFTGQTLVLSGQFVDTPDAFSTLDISTTWNTTGSPTAIKLNVTNTLSAVGSLLMRLASSTAGFYDFVGSGSQGEIVIGSFGQAGRRTGYHGISGLDGGNLYFGCNNGNVTLGNTSAAQGGNVSISSLGLSMQGSLVLRWYSGSTPFGTGVIDTGISRNAAGVVEINNGTAGQFRDLQARYHFGSSGGGFYLFSSLGGAAYAASLFETGGAAKFRMSNGAITWTGSNDAGTGVDAELKRNAAGILEFNNGIDRRSALRLNTGQFSFDVTFDNVRRTQWGMGARLGADCGINWANTNPSDGALDTALWRNAAGVVEINNGTLGQYRDLKARKLSATDATNYISLSVPQAGCCVIDYDGAYGLWLSAAGIIGVHYGWLAYGSNSGMRWSPFASNFYASTYDTGVSRNAAGVVEINNGTAGQYRDLVARKLILNGNAYLTSGGVGSMTIGDSGGGAGALAVAAVYTNRVRESPNDFWALTTYNGLNGLFGGPTTVVTWAAGAWYGTADLAITRNAAGVLEINNGTAGQYRDLKLRNLIVAPTALGTVRDGAMEYDGTMLWFTIGTTRHQIAPRPPGVSMGAFYYQTHTGSQAASDPGPGKMRWNHATQQLATELYFDWITEDGFDPTQLFITADIGTEFVIQDKDFALKWQKWRMTGAAINMPDWFKVPAVLVEASDGTNFANQLKVAVLVQVTEAAMGSDMQVQFNDLGRTAGATDLLYNKNTKATGVRNLVYLPPAADGTASGPTTSDYNAGYTTAVGDLVYLDVAGTWQKCDTNTSYDGMPGIVLEVKNAGQAVKVALPGSTVWAAAKFPTFTIGRPVYMDLAGAVTHNPPVATNSATRMMGWATHADKMYFFPSPDYITHA